MIITLTILDYVLGIIVSYWMLKIDHVSEGQPYTHGVKTVNIVLSLISWLVVLIILIAAWISGVRKTGYWNKPINDSKQ